MHVEEINTFISKVKLKKVRLSSWAKLYFIPYGKTTYDAKTSAVYMMGSLYDAGTDGFLEETQLMIGNGFEPNDSGYKWEFLENPTLPTGIYKCTCDIRSVWAYGCKCGGI